MSGLGFFFDETRCIGCRTCQIACKDKNRIMEPGITFRTVRSYESGSFPNPGVYHLATTCNHCEDPACVASCPVGAMYKAVDGTVQHDDEACIGCQACVNSCPYGVPQYFEDDGIVRKCDSCIAHRQHGRNPVCVDACVMRALEFGDLDELREKHGYDLVSELPAWPDGGTSPHTVVKAEEFSLRDEFTRIVL